MPAAEAGPGDPGPARSPSNGRPRSPRRAAGLRFAAFARWLHIYLSMFGLAAVLFFSVTGLTLNHPDWFFGNVEHVTEAADAAPGFGVRVGVYLTHVTPDWTSLCQQLAARSASTEGA